MCQPNKNGEGVRREVESSFEGVWYVGFFQRVKSESHDKLGILDKLDKLTCLDDMLQFQHYAVQSQ